MTEYLDIARDFAEGKGPAELFLALAGVASFACLAVPLAWRLGRSGARLAARPALALRWRPEGLCKELLGRLQSPRCHAVLGEPRMKAPGLDVFWEDSFPFEVRLVLAGDGCEQSDVWALLSSREQRVVAAAARLAREQARARDLEERRALALERLSRPEPVKCPTPAPTPDTWNRKPCPVSL